MYQTTRMGGWTRALAIVVGLVIMGIGFTVVFFPSIVVGILTFLFAVAFIMIGLYALATGISGERVVMTQRPRATPPPTQQETERGQGVRA